MQLSREARVVAGVILLTAPAIMYGGLTLLGILTGGGAGLRPGDLQLTDTQWALFRAGHAHAGVWVILSLVLQVFIDGAVLGDGLRVAGTARRPLRRRRHLRRLLRAPLRAHLPVAGLSRRGEHGGLRAGHRHRPAAAPAGGQTGWSSIPMTRDVLQSALRTRFGPDAFRAGAPPDPVAVFPARHLEVGDAVLWVEPGPYGGADVRIEIGRVLHDGFHSFDTHLDPAERAARVTRDVVRFLDKLFADQLLFWTRDEGTFGGWRECEDARTAEPLVTDNRVYRTFAWSGPLETWQAVPHILSRNRIRDERDHQILLAAIAQTGEQLGPDDCAHATRLIDEYERRGGA
jgi:hypothetical protein